MQFSGPDCTLVASYPVAEATWNEDKNPLLPSGIIGRERDCVRFKSTSSFDLHYKMEHFSILHHNLLWSLHHGNLICARPT